jgi:hypothetical protein
VKKYLNNGRSKTDTDHDVHVTIKVFGHRFDASSRVNVFVHFDYGRNVLNIVTAHDIDESALFGVRVKVKIGLD